MRVNVPVLLLVSVLVQNCCSVLASSESGCPDFIGHDRNVLKPSSFSTRFTKRRTDASGLIHRYTKVQQTRGGADDPSKDSGKESVDAGGRTSMTASMFNLVNNVAGAGILSLSAGQAAGTGWIPAMGICVILGVLSARTFAMVGESCEMLNEKDFKGLWKRTVGERSVFFVDAMIAFLCFAVNIIYSGILGDISTFLLGQTGIPSGLNNRITNILVITAGLLFPMSLIKDLSILAFTSILGFVAIMYTVLLIVGRAFDGTYKLGSGEFVLDGALKAMPSFDKQSLWNVDFTSLVLISTLGLAYVSHYNAPTFYRQLENANSRRFGKLTYISFFVLTLLYALTMGAGYSTFGENCMSNILLNYHPNDLAATFGRVATWFSILFGFPLVSLGAREGLIGVASSLGFPQLGLDKYHFPIVLALISLVTLIACSVDDISFVVGITGALFGSFIVYICPTLIYVKAVELSKGKGSREHMQAQWNYPLIPFGIFVGLFGVYITIKEASGKAGQFS